MVPSRTIVRVGVAVSSLTLFGIAAMSAACGSAPADSGTEASSAALGVTTCGGAPFTQLVQHPRVCTGTVIDPPPTGGSSGAALQSVGELKPEGITCTPAYDTCDPVAATGWSRPDWGLSCWNASGAVNVAAVPAALAGKGCTPGVALTGDYFVSAGVWACPAGVTVPSTGLGAAPMCDPSTLDVVNTDPALPNGAKGPLCETVYQGSTFNGPGVGDAYAGWTLIEERVFSTSALDEQAVPDSGNVINHGCSSACARPTP